MNCMEVNKILNEYIFGKDKEELIQKISENPERFTGLFRPTKPYAKILQFLLQSHEIKFGDAMERVISRILEYNGFTVEVGKKICVDGATLEIDIFLWKNEHVYAIEVKIRDDHDSSKKEGQIINFQRKIEGIIREYDENDVVITGIMYFLDDNLKKNRKYYSRKLDEIKKMFSINTFLLYGSELFEFFNLRNEWENLIDCIRRWKFSLPELPIIDYDGDVEDSFRRLKDISIITWKRILEEDQLWEEHGVMRSLFKTGETLKRLLEFFRNKEGKLKNSYNKIAKLMERRIKDLYQEV